MTATTNGASLEDCLTNIFSLIDLNGIRWKRFKHKENNNYLYTPIDTHPILTTYAKCIEENHIAVWRHEPQKRHSSGSGGGGPSGGHSGSANAGATSHSNFPTPTRASNNNTPTSGGPSNQGSGNQGASNQNSNNASNSNSNNNNTNNNNYELWIFGYGHQLKVDNVIGEDLVEIEDDTWESKGLSYECRTLLFKALHNLIERCLITKGFTRMGRWFVQPMSSLSFAFSFFVHGDSTVCATVDVRHHPQVQPLTRADLTAFQEGGIVRVALAPYGLNGILNGVSYKDSDNGAATTTFIQQWSKFYPLPKTLSRLVPGNKSSTNSAMTSTPSSTTATNFNNQKTTTNTSTNQFNQSTNDSHGSRSYLSNLTNMLFPPSHKPQVLHFNHEPNEVPPIVEVIVAGYRMRYPAECVFTTSKVVDLYKSLSISSNPRPTSSLSFPAKRPNKSSPNKPNKLSLLSEKLNEDNKLDSSSTRVKIEPSQDQQKQNQLNRTQTTANNFNSPFNLSSLDSIDSRQSIQTSDSSSTNISQVSFLKQATGVDKITNGPDLDGGSSNNSSSNQTTIPRFNTTKIGFSNTPLGPTDLVKLFPTPPSLEQLVQSPSALGEETGLREITTLSPANVQQSNDLSKDNGIDVYKPVECALMPPPPKWAALTNIIISSSKSLPPEYIYKGSSQAETSGKNIISRFCESNKRGLAKNSSISKHHQVQHSLLTSKISTTTTTTTINSQPISSPLTDQTNKNGFNSLNLNISSPKVVVSSSLLTPTVSNLAATNDPSMTSTIPSSTTAFSSFSLPHQRLFNNLNEVNSIQLNLLISDSVLGMFKDHNFESCTLCVCNMSIKGTQLDTIPQRVDNTNQWRQPSGNDSSTNNSGEFINECTCGFSAITNRHCSHLSGLFLEDELELTNVLYDPTEMIDQNKLFRKLRLSNYSETSYSDEHKIFAKMTDANNKNIKGTDDNSSQSVKPEKTFKDDKSSQSISQTIFEETKIFVIDQLKQQCSFMIHSNSSLSKVLLIESFRNNRHLTSCSNYYAQTTSKTGVGGSAGPFYRFLDESNKYTTVKMMNRNPMSLKFSDFCELTKSIILKLGNQNQANSRLANSLVKPLSGSTSSGLGSIFSRMFSPNRSMIGKSSDMHANNRNNIFIQGLQALIVPTLSIDPKGALQMLEHLVKEESKEALATLNKAILIFSSPIHDWQYLTAPVPENNFDVANLLKIIQPTLDESIGSPNKLYKDFVHQQQQHIFSARDSPTGAPTLPTPPCQGPLTWRQFHQGAGRGTEDQCEPQPIPSLLVGHHVEKNHLAISPFALKFWDKLLLEPYAPGHNLFYLIIAPDNQNILGHINPFFKELSNTYELMKLGRHTPIGNGLIVASNSAGTENTLSSEESWFSNLCFSEKEPLISIANKLRTYAAKLNSTLAKTIVDFMEERQPPHDPHADRFDSSPSPQGTTSSANKNPSYQPISRVNQQATANRTFNNLLGNSAGSLSTQMPHDAFGGYSQSTESQVSSEVSSQLKSQSLIGGSSAHGGAEDNIFLEDEANKQSGIVIYMIDPFSSPSINQNLRALTTIGLLKCYSMLLDCLPDHIKRITQLQLISLDSIISHSRPILNISRVDQLKSLSMNIYSRCRKILTNQATAKSLTGFGPAAALDKFFKTKNTELSISKMFTPPFILAPMKDKQTELGEMFGDRREKSSVLFCSYCITEDQRWLLASVTNDKGEMAETTVININIIDRMKRPKASVKRVALRKLMEFIVSVMSDWMNPWRLIIGKLGRVGHGELKEWAALMSKRSLLNYSRHLTERCRQCSILPATETVSILSACLVSLEPDSRLRIMPDQFTSDDRQASFNKCPLSTPEDASATHILVFPTSASIQSSHGNVEDPLAGSGLDDDLLNQFPLEDGIEDLGVEENMDDLFSAWDDGPTNVSDHINSHHDTMMMSSSNLQMGTGSVGDSTSNQDETLQLLQQPLALGYYISTAKIGQMPNWFWSTSPHLRNSCPVFLKSALHIHMPCVQLSDDLLHSGVGQSRKSHQLDSNLTTDVLRYVLEGYNSLSWLVLNPKTYDRQSCLPVHMQNLLQLYHLMESFS